MSAHAKYSPSGASRWLACPASIVVSEGLPDESSPDANYGTAAHQLAQMCFETGKPAAAFLGRKLDWIDGEKIVSIEVDDEMVEGVQTYLELVSQIAGDNEVLVEQRVPIGHITGEAGATGTADVVVFRDDDELIVIDLKFGRGVEVEAEESPQGIMYGLGALEQFGLLGDFKRFRFVIIQPRISSAPKEWSCSIAELQARAKEFSDGAALAELAGQFRENWVHDGSSAYYNPTEKACQFCRAKAVCPALALHVQKTVGADFADLTIASSYESHEKLVPTTEESLASAMSAIDVIEDWCKAVRAEVERRLTQGVAVPGYKLVQGKRGNRRWDDEAVVEDILRKQMRLPMETVYKMELKGPAPLEKLLKDQPKRWATLTSHITQSDGKASVAHESDPRPALSLTATVDDFANLAPAPEASVDVPGADLV